MVEERKPVTGGVDTHKEVHVAAAVDRAGRLLGTRSFATTPAGYAELSSWLGSFGVIECVGVEGTGAYGAGLARHLAAVGVEVVEVNRPNRQMRRRRGKNDTVDAEAAARAALNGQADVVPKSHDGIVESIRVLRIAFCSARTSRVQVGSQIRDLVLTAPDSVRTAFEPLSIADRVERAARFRPGAPSDPLEATRTAMRSLARRYQALTTEMEELRRHLDALTIEANPALRAAKGVGVDVASILLVAAGDNPERLRSDAAFAALCGASPIEASSGRTNRHRLNQGGNRQANHALWRIAMVRLSNDPATQAYAARRRADGKSTREIIRCLKRYIAREIFALLTGRERAEHLPDTSDLRPARLAAGVSLQTVADHFGVWPARISELERGLKRDDELEQRYRTWLTLRAA